MILAYHVIVSTYGFWLPNDPRGSWSDFVGAWELFKFGKATKVSTRQSVAEQPHDIKTRLAAKVQLKYPPVQLTGVQARAVGQGFGTQVRKSGLAVWACSILPDHVHLVIKRHHYEVEQVVRLLKGSATRELARQGLHPLAKYACDGVIPTPWTHKQWKVFLDCEADIRRAIEYVRENPVKEGKPHQRWTFVKELRR